MTKSAIEPGQPVVLIVDDQQSIRTVLCDLLTISFPLVSVVEAHNGTSAFEAVMDARPGLVLMDVFLPDSNGIELTRRIMSHAADTIVIVMSTDHSVRTRELAIEAGARQFIAKDQIFEQLMPLLSQLYLQPEDPAPGARTVR